MARRLLVIEDESVASRESLGRLLLLEAGFSCEYVRWESLATERLIASNAQLIVALPVREASRAMNLLNWLHGHPIATPTLAVLPSESDDELVRMASEAAADFILGPLRKGEFVSRVERILGKEGDDAESIRYRLTQEMGLAELVGKEASFMQAIEKIPMIAKNDAPVLLLGETGTGKELCARAIHYLSRRASFPFIPVECGALPEHLAENELFGHRRGAFTDAHTDQKGLAGMAEHGTLFLDEVDALSLAAQAKLLRFLQEGTFRALGADRFTRANVRVVAATNCNLETRLREKQFRSDLYFRLNVLQLRLPPLRERRGDIALLAHHFLRSISQQSIPEQKTLSAGALRMLEQYDWPGNLRELFNVLQRAMVFCPGTQILPAHIPLPGSSRACATTIENFRSARLQAIQSFERVYVEDMLRRHHGNITRAAAGAGQDRRAFGRLVKKYGVDRKAV